MLVLEFSNDVSGLLQGKIHPYSQSSIMNIGTRVSHIPVGGHLHGAHKAVPQVFFKK